MTVVLAETEDEIEDWYTSPNTEVQKNALASALRMVEGFALYFVVCDPAVARPQLMEETENAIAPKTVQRAPITRETRNLLHLLQDTLEEPLPDVIFIYGLENWISGAVEPRSIPFILNLNAARNHFYHLISRPMVFFIPVHVMNAIINGAPDFFSVRSGAYTFPLSPDERTKIHNELIGRGWTEIQGIPWQTKENEIHQAENFLATYRSLSTSDQNPEDIIALCHSLAFLYESKGDFVHAEPLLIEALTIAREIWGDKDPRVAQSLNNLAVAYKALKRYEQAEKLCVEALEIYRESLPHNHPNIAVMLNNLAGLYAIQCRYREAESLLIEALDIRRKALSSEHTDLATSLNNLALSYRLSGDYTTAESLYIEALNIRRKNLSEEHPDTAQTYYNLAELYDVQGRYVEADQYFRKAAIVCRKILGDTHPHTKEVIESYDQFQRKRQGAEGVTTSNISLLEEKVVS
ncbi:MAG: hypothetical protein OHK0029_07270 [Armatimonadaceae bacterium]